MGKRVKILFLWGIPVVLLFVIQLFRWYPSWSEWYARHCYGTVAGILSSFSSLFPFSVGDCFIVMLCLWLLSRPFCAWKKKKKGWRIAGNTVKTLMWIYIWFYLAWGINYFRLPFYERTKIERVEYDAQEFNLFMKDYISYLDSSFEAVNKNIAWYTDAYSEGVSFAGVPVGQEIEKNYGKLTERFGLIHPCSLSVPKNMLWSKGMSMVGVTGYMGPFFNEFHLNRELLNIEYPFTYAHELAHRLGIASEAEANLYAFIVTTSSEVPEIRLSGYFSLLGYVMNNGRRLLPKEEYQAMAADIPKEILDVYRKHLQYWRVKYNPLIGRVQNSLYDAYLKGNKIGSGTKNYSEVIGLLMSLRRGRFKD